MPPLASTQFSLEHVLHPLQMCTPALTSVTKAHMSNVALLKFTSVWFYLTSKDPKDATYTTISHLPKPGSFIFPLKKKPGPNVVRQTKLNSMAKWNRCNKGKQGKKGGGWECLLKEKLPDELLQFNVCSSRRLVCRKTTKVGSPPSLPR